MENKEIQLKIKMEEENEKYRLLIHQKQEEFTRTMADMKEEILKQSESFIQKE